MRSVLRLLILLGLVAGAQTIFAGPFGLAAGMTRQQVVDIVGKGHISVLEADHDTLVMGTVPSPHSAFELYFCTFSQKYGLVKITAMGHNINTPHSGDLVKDEFYRMVMAVERVYGRSDRIDDRLLSASTLTSEDDWMEALKYGERKLEASWANTQVKQKDEKISQIHLEAKARSKDQGWIELTYYFSDFQKYSDEKEAVEDKSL